jgi:hypothetical protein
MNDVIDMIVHGWSYVAGCDDRDNIVDWDRVITQNILRDNIF